MRPIAFGAPKRLRWRPRASSGAQLGGPKRSKTPTWKLQAVQDPNLEVPSLPKTPSWRPKAFLGARFRRSEIDFRPFGTLKIELSCRRELNFHVTSRRAFHLVKYDMKRMSSIFDISQNLYIFDWFLAILFNEFDLHTRGLNLELTGSLWGRTWPYSGASWAQFGASWASIGVALEPLGRVLGSTWGLLGRFWANLEALGINSETLGRFLDLNLEAQSVSRSQLGRPKASKDAIFGVQIALRPLLGGPKRVRNECFIFEEQNFDD